MGSDHRPESPAGTKRLSTVLVELGNTPAERISFDDILVALSERSFGALLILFSALNLLPLPPGSSTVFGIPLVLLSIQMLIGLENPWFPAFLRRKSMRTETYRSGIARLESVLARFERLARPRYWLFPQIIVERVVSIVALLMSLIVILPIPLINQIPALSIILLAIGLGEQDGVWLGTGFLVAALAAGIAIGLGASVGLAALHIFG
ncbi:exopolysaccharide biosynthesis protein [Phyllobacterium sp. YR531]|uniref:exopolysaccharide biosynthesis protein n=1 Tax=Phyllobacterium sp. YR531 TaxID=1144343 RepID=UPI00026F9922|nr:exopolysaccharide biosynthesis protein [Phyllobacterium sp. YR531]EJM99254.1 putative ABC-type transport system, permease component [Phyllobacterium sp. YR531]